MKNFFKKLFNISNSNSETNDLEELKDGIGTNDLEEIKEEVKEESGPKNGLVETYVDYEEDGEKVKMKCSVNYKDGETDGLYTMTDPDGGIRLKMNYVMGVKEGLVEQFHKNGNLLNRQEFKDDMENGIDEMYDDQGNGRLVTRSNFVNGLEDGLCEYIDEEGKVFLTITFKNGEEID
tara:strand:+ start:413 stop:946 length:534 start_codon:yes stop_codon:yes gene_type:complete